MTDDPSQPTATVSRPMVPTVDRRRAVVGGLAAAIGAGLTGRLQVSAAVNRPAISGVVKSRKGAAVADAWVTDGSTYTFTDEDGTFAFPTGTITPGSSLTVNGSGYRQERLPAPRDASAVDVRLDPMSIRGIYFNPWISNTDDGIANYIQITRSTNVNAVVIDIKENVVLYDTDIEIFRNAGMVNPIMNVRKVVSRFRDAGVYTIARIVLFKDPWLAESHPDYAVKDVWTGGPWRDSQGVAWTNPLSRPIWKANIDLAMEAVAAGFDEIQWDYVRFPTDGDMTRARYGEDNTQTMRESTIEAFLEASRAQLIPAGARQSADVFGYTTVVEDDLGIGQNLDQLGPRVDYLSPMLYPSHWPTGSIAVPGLPNEYPYETILISMDAAKRQLKDNPLPFRPWLQDFGVPGQRVYGAADVRAQIQALEDLDIRSWLIWAPSNWYHTDALT